MTGAGTALDVTGTLSAKIVALDGTVGLNTGAVLNATSVNINGGTTTVDSGVTVNGDFSLNAGGTLAIGGNVDLASLVFNNGAFHFGGVGNTLTLGA